MKSQNLRKAQSRFLSSLLLSYFLLSLFVSLFLSFLETIYYCHIISSYSAPAPTDLFLTRYPPSVNHLLVCERLCR